jgi:diguanylate cyclase (GGDEF)-like protein/PAS domain S-box-containing protein
MIKIRDQFHPILKRQVKKHLPQSQCTDDHIQSFITAIHDTYISNDEGRHLMEQALEVSSEELLQKNSEIRTIFEAFPDIFFRIDAEGKILDYKSSSMTIAQLFPEQMVGRLIQDFSFVKVDPVLIKQIRESNELLTYEHSLATQDKTVYFEVRLKSLLKDQAIIIIRDITERKIAEEKLKFAALHDQLTLLPNRTLLHDRLVHFIRRHQRNPQFKFAVLFIDFDRFKVINDSLGHQVGDELLVSISERMKKALRGVDTVARLGGDEFFVIIDEVKTDQDVVTVVTRLQEKMSAPYFVGNKEVFLTISTGIVISADPGRTPDDYIRDADIAMYSAKNNGRSQYVIFNDEMRQQTIKIMDLEGDLHRAIKNNEFELYYQPIVSLGTKTILRMEALIRWIHPAKGMIPPGEFIPQAEQTGLILKIGEFVLHRACMDCKKWQKEGFPNLGVAINFSPLQFHHTNLPALIRDVLEATHLGPEFLEVEITEGIAMKNIEFTINTLRKLKSMKVMVSIDDFGTGYSSLGSLIEFPLDSLKIYRKFIQHVSGHRHSNSLTTAIISLAHNLGLKVVGEGIENTDQLQFLTRNKCDEGQGYLFSRPIPGDQLLAVLKTIKFPQ